MKWFIIVFFAISSVSCSMLKRKCEKTDWFTYAKQVALNGRRLGSDNFYQKCQKKEAEIDEMSADQGFKEGMNEYCENDSPFEYGKKGLKYNFDFCGNINIKKMKADHVKGLREYCLPSNGYSEGIKGDKYNKLCPKDLEKSFLIEFNKGRIKYLKAEIVEKDSLIADLERSIRKQEREYDSLKRDLRDIDRYYSSDNRVIIGAGSIIISPRTRRRLRTKEEVDAERYSIRSDISSAQRRIRSKEQKLAAVKSERRKLEKEIILLKD